MKTKKVATGEEIEIYLLGDECEENGNLVQMHVIVGKSFHGDSPRQVHEGDIAFKVGNVVGEVWLVKYPQGATGPRVTPLVQNARISIAAGMPYHFRADENGCASVILIRKPRATHTENS